MKLIQKENHQKPKKQDQTNENQQNLQGVIQIAYR